MPSAHRGLLMMMGLAVAAFAGDPPRTIGPYGAEVQVAFAPDGKRLAVTVKGGSGALIDPAKGEQVRRFDGDAGEAESAVAVSADGKSFALACKEGWVRVFDVESGDELASFSHDGPVRSMAFTSDGRGLVTGGGLPWKEAAPAAEGEEPAPSDVPDADGPTARVWDPATGGKLHDLDPKTGNATSGVAASPAAPVVAVARGDGKVVLFDLEKKKRHEVEVPGCGPFVAFSGDGKLVAVAGGAEQADCTLVDVGAGQVARALGKRPGEALGPVAISPDGKTVACASEGVDGVRLHDAAGGPARALKTGAVASLAFSPDGATLAIGLRTGQVVLHDLAPGGGLGDEKK